MRAPRCLGSAAMVIRSSAVALSADRPRKSANFLTWRMYWYGVLGLSRRISMSSINRRRNGLMAFSVIGGSCLERGSRPLNLKTGRLLLATPETARLATNYRESGFVLRSNVAVRRAEANVVLSQQLTLG